MESVIKKIRKAQEEIKMNKNKVNASIHEMIIDKCHVKINFNQVGDSKILSTIQSMLISAHLDALYTSPLGGESL